MKSLNFLCRFVIYIQETIKQQKQQKQFEI